MGTAKFNTAILDNLGSRFVSKKLDRQICHKLKIRVKRPAIRRGNSQPEIIGKTPFEYSDRLVLSATV